MRQPTYRYNKGKEDKSIKGLIITSAFLGAALAMDAFSVSLANGMTNRKMRMNEMHGIAGTFAAFQFTMPMIGWALVHTAVEYLEWFDRFVPWIALILLCLIGAKMIKDGLADRKCGTDDEGGAEGEKSAEGENSTTEKFGFALLMIQGIATSIDALSVGFTTARYVISEAILSSVIIGVVTFIICMAGCMIGKKAGTALSWKATVLGGMILFLLGIKIFIG